MKKSFAYACLTSHFIRLFSISLILYLKQKKKKIEFCFDKKIFTLAQQLKNNAKYKLHVL